MIEATGIIICKGFALFEGVGVNDSAMIGFIVSFTIVIPETFSDEQNGIKNPFYGIVSFETFTNFYSK